MLRGYEVFGLDGPHPDGVDPVHGPGTPTLPIHPDPTSHLYPAVIPSVFGTAK